MVKKIPNKPLGIAFSCLSWNGLSSDFLHNQLTVGTSDGRIICYQANTNKMIFELKEKIEGDPQINAFDYSQDSSKILVVGAESNVRLYDVEKQTLLSNFSGNGMIPSHSNRVFACKFLPDQNLFVTSGWDQRILWWDIRTDTPHDSTHGTQIYGDGIDVKEGLLLACSFRDTKAIKLFTY